MSGSRKRAFLIVAALSLPLAAILAVVPLRADESRTTVRVGPKVVVTESDDAYLGVQIEEETEYPEGGARITEVVDDSPADEAGLMDGDIVVRFGGDTIRGPAALTEHIHSRKAGDKVTLTVVRGGREQTIEVELGERSGMWSGFKGLEGLENLRNLENLIDPEQIEKWKELGEHYGRAFTCEGDDCEGTLLGPGVWSFNCDGDDCAPMAFGWRGRARLGVHLVEVTPELRQHLGARDDRGVLVSKVVDGTPAEKAGIAVGDLIVSVAGQSVASTGELRQALRDQQGKTFDVVVVREGRTTTLSVTLPDVDEDAGPQARELQRLGHEIRREMRAAMVEAREAQRAALADRRREMEQVRAELTQTRRRQMQEVREAMSEAREALREAERARRDAVREALREARRPWSSLTEL